MHMPGRKIVHYKGEDKKQQMMKVINDVSSKNVFFAKVKLECPEERINELINFAPVFRSYDIKNDEQTIGKYMYEYGNMNNISSVTSKNNIDRKLTMTLDTMGEYKVFYCYYLWLLIDLGLKVVDVEEVVVYSANKAFNAFVTEFMKNRQDIIAGIKEGNQQFYKIAMNGSYGYDGMNESHYNKVKICDKDTTCQAICSDNYRNGYRLNDECYILECEPKAFGCKTCLQIAAATLDCAKFWFVTFYYKFLVKAFDIEHRAHLTTIDTDSMYFAVDTGVDTLVENPLKYIIKDQMFYDMNAKYFLPDESINDKLQRVRDEKKILGCCVEKYGDNQVALCPKCYTIFNNDDNKAKTKKAKGVSLKNSDIEKCDYIDVIKNKAVVKGTNYNLQTVNNVMSKVCVEKNALTGFNNKLITLMNESCAPFMKDIDANSYIVIDSVEEDVDYDKVLERIFGNVKTCGIYYDDDKDIDVSTLTFGERVINNAIKTYNYNKFGTKQATSLTELGYLQTGIALKTNMCKYLSVIDIDINKALDEDTRGRIFKEIQEKLSKDDVIVRSGSGGMHIYCNNNIYFAEQNRYVKCFESENYDIDYITSNDKNKCSIIMLPYSRNEKGEYTFVQGSYESTITRSARDVLVDIGCYVEVSRFIKDGDTKKKFINVSVEDDDMYVTHDIDYERKLVNGLYGIEVHGTATTGIDNEVSLLPLCQAINCLSSELINEAYNNVITKCKLTMNARSKVDKVINDNQHKRNNIGVLRKIVQLYNPEYYQSTF